MDQRELVERAGRAIMTPSRRSSARPSRGWKPSPASSSGTRSSRETRSRRHTSEPGATCRACAIRQVRGLAPSPDRQRVPRCRRAGAERRPIEVELSRRPCRGPAGTRSGSSPTATSWSAASAPRCRPPGRLRPPLLRRACRCRRSPRPSTYRWARPIAARTGPWPDSAPGNRRRASARRPHPGGRSHEPPDASNGS